MLYLDTSALVKLYIDEPGSRRTRREKVLANQLTTSVLTLPEFGSALARRLHAGDLVQADVTSALSRFREDMGQFALVTMSRALAQQALDLVSRHRIRGADAAQLASALYMARQVAGLDSLVIIAADRHLGVTHRAALLRRRAHPSPGLAGPVEPPERPITGSAPRPPDRAAPPVRFTENYWRRLYQQARFCDH